MDPDGKPGVTAHTFDSARQAHTHAYLWPTIRAMAGELPAGSRVLDVGCGNGSLSARFLELGCTVVGLDASETGIAAARRAFPKARWEVLLADDQVLANLGEPPFDVVVSTEVVEHLYSPAAYMRGCVAALRPGGRLIISTPYHGYLKNLVLSLTDHWDQHHSPMWEGGHIKFWSRRTLSRLLSEAGLVDLRFRGAGRLPWMWKSMVMSARKPHAPGL